MCECVCAITYYVMLSTRQCPYIEHSIGRCDTFVVRTKSGLPSFTPYHLIALSLSLSLSSSGVLHIEQWMVGVRMEIQVRRKR